jgi:hypothetical protein
MPVEPALISKLTQSVSRQYPEMASVKPSVRKQSKPGGGSQFLLTYKGKAQLPGGRTMSRIVRVVADENGRLIRMSTSK